MCVKDFLWQSQLQEFWGLIPEVLKKPWCCCCLCWVMTDPAQTSFARLNFSTSKLRIAFPPCHQRSLVWNKAGWRNTTSGKHSKTHMTITPHLAPAGRHSSCPNAPTFSVSAQGSFTDTLAHVLFHICCRAVVPMLGVIPQHWHMAWQYHWHTYTLESWKSQKKTQMWPSLWYLHLSGITRKPVHPQNPHGSARHGKAAALPHRGTRRWLPRMTLPPVLLALDNVTRSVKEPPKKV